ncbi:hypothetical protein [Marinivivus vitaminiproducens]|uniref:hypothetical protein n=1 Tax=Marinivivus vitaminiproducens TaxID=3035935 RepID=UPI0027A69941|nr:hypothetical protein P4R82_17620 [Geminicoccaceae bacterium SCSIO 64248]
MQAASPAGHPAGLLRLEFDQALILRDPGQGLVWLLEGEAAAWWRDACLDDAAAAIAALVDNADSDLPSVRARDGWRLPAQPATLDRILSDGGARVRVRCWEPRLSAALDRMLAPLTAPAGPVDRTLDLLVQDGMTGLFEDGAFVSETGRIAWTPLIRRLARALNGERDWLGVVHAATVGLGSGTVMLVGKTGSGKTTLAGGLIAHGGALVADDATAIEAETGLAWPCPLAMGVKAGSWPLFADLFPGFAATTALQAGARHIRYFETPRRVAGGVARRIDAIVFPTWQSGADVQVARLRPAEALKLLSSSGTWPVDDDRRLPDFLAWFKAVPAWRLTYDRLPDAIAAMDILCGDSVDDANARHFRDTV